MGLIDDQFSQAQKLKTYLIEKSEVSFLSYIEPNLAKIFLLQCASFHESEVLEILKIFSSEKSKSPKLSNFVTKFMVERQYDKLFMWEQSNKNVNKFLAFFGQDFKEECLTEIENNAVLEDGIKSFIEIGSLRNTLIHNNLANFTLNKTIEEIYEMHNKAIIFIQYIKNKLLK